MTRHALFDGTPSGYSNGHTNGRLNGQSNGHSNGHLNVHSNGHVNGNGNGQELSEYEQIGRELLQSMKNYENHLSKDGGTIPSLHPTALENVQSDSRPGEMARKRVIELAEQILATTMDPNMNLMINSLQFHFCSCLKVAVDLDIAKHIPKFGQISLSELAEATGAEDKLLVRIMRVLTTKYVFAEPQTGFYSHTAMSWAMSGDNQKYLLLHRLDDGFRSSSREPDALRLNGYREPILDDKYGFNLAFYTEDKFWDYMATAEPIRGAGFNRAMKAVNINSLNAIPTLYPFNELSRHGGLIVDVGGGLGQVGRTILAHYSSSGLRCVVQDQFADANRAANTASQKDEFDLNVNIVIQQHNFFDPQPIPGAAAYFFRHIFHDWPDSACIDILRKTIPAMDKEHSRILICDQVMEKISPSTASVLYDIDMMSMFGGKERQLTEWETLIAEADKRLRITDVRKSPTSPTSIIEVRFS